MQTIPLQSVASQTLQITLNSQACTINVYTKQIQGSPPNFVSSPCYIDLIFPTNEIYGIILLNGVKLVRDAYWGFVGDIACYDTQGDTDPVYTGLGTRYQLVYLAPSDL
jgi:hypothetical protein